MLFGNTVDNAIKGLLKAQTNLENVAVAHAHEADALNERAAGLIDKANTAMNEAERAQRVLGKLREITEA